MAKGHWTNFILVLQQSAGLGNAVADLIGTAFRGYIERMSGNFMPEVKISSRQLESKEAWWAETVGASAGPLAWPLVHCLNDELVKGHEHIQAL